VNGPTATDRPRLRVEVIVDTLGAGGAEFLLADYAAAATGVGVEAHVTSLKPLSPPSPAADRLRRRGLEPAAVPVTSMVSPRSVMAVRQHLGAAAPDLVHTHLGTADFVGGLAARSLRLPLVSTIHADWFGESRADRTRSWLAGRVRRHCAERVIAVSDSSRDAYLRAGRDRPEHVIVVRNGIEDRARPGSGRRIRAELGLGPDDLVLTAVSALRAEKNFEAAIDAVALLASRFPTARFLIAGDGPHAPAVRAHARGQEAVVLTGHREDVMELLDATDVLVHPSHFDAFPTTLLEAMAASVPVVATGVGGMLEIVEPGKTGVLVPPPPTAERLAEALAPLLDDQVLRARLGAEGRARYERDYGTGPWLERLRSVYDAAVSGRFREPGGLRPSSTGSPQGVSPTDPGPG
jgi:glycosyltransferase involved in cell wall biosynthesis